MADLTTGWLATVALAVAVIVLAVLVYARFRRDIRAAQELMGKEGRVMVDANQVFNRNEALRRGRVYQDMGCFWYEEPLPPHDMEGYALLAEELDTDLAELSQAGSGAGRGLPEARDTTGQLLQGSGAGRRGFEPRLHRALERLASSERLGDRVAVKLENPAGNPRTPKYIRGKKGVIVEAHGVISNLRDHRGLYPPLYTVAFDVREVFGTDSADQLRVDLLRIIDADAVRDHAVPGSGSFQAAFGRRSF